MYYLNYLLSYGCDKVQNQSPQFQIDVSVCPRTVQYDFEIAIRNSRNSNQIAVKCQNFPVNLFVKFRYSAELSQIINS